MQSYALVLLRYLDDLEKSKKDIHTFKLTMATRQEFNPQNLFPDYFLKNTTEDGHDHPDGPDTITPDDLRDVNWVSPKDAAEDWERLSKMLANGGGKGFLSGEDLTGLASQTNEIEWTEWS